MTLKALLFDVDGTLVDTEELHRRAFNQAFIEFELGWEWGLARYAELLGVSGGVDRIARHIDGLQATPTEKVRLRKLIPAIHGTKTRIYGELLGGASARLRPGIARLFDEAREAGLRIGLLATSGSANVHVLISQVLDAEARGAIASVVSADQVPRKKPAPDIYELLLSTLRVSAQDCVAFEDSENGLAAAKAAGLPVVVVPSRWTMAQNFSGADLLLPALGDPDSPLDPSIAVRIGGAPFLGLAHVEALHAYLAR
jgi:HAD superfamily hydrolase (TIGR01509 family)